MTKKFDKKFGPDFITQVPLDPGVYRVYDSKGELFYVGKAASLRKRISQYRLAKRIRDHSRMRKVVEAADRWEWEVTPSHESAELREIQLIRELRPKFNLTAAFSRIYPFFAIRTDPVSGWSWFVFTHRQEACGLGYQIHGAWRSRSLAQEAFEALNELLALISTSARRSELFSDRSGLSGRLERNARVFAQRGLSPGWILELGEYLEGRSTKALETLAIDLLDSDRARRKGSRVEEQLKVLREFYREETRPFADARKRLKLKEWPIPQEKRDEINLRARQIREGRAQVDSP